MLKKAGPSASTLFTLSLPLFLLLFGTIGYRLIEGWPLLDALYMTVITIATVGFSEIHQLSETGRVFTIVLIIMGVVIITYCIQYVVLYMIQKNVFGSLWRRNMEKRIESLRDHVIVCGYGKIGYHVVEHFLSTSVKFVVIEAELPDQEALKEKGILFIEGHAEDEAVLKHAGIERAATLVAVVGKDADNLFITLTARGMNPDIKVVARAEDGANKNKLLRAGADKVVLPYELGGRRIASQVLMPSVTDFLETAMGNADLELRMAEVRVDASSSIQGKTLLDSDVRKKTGTIILAIKTEGGGTVTNPSPETVINTGDLLICLGTSDQIKALQKLAGGKR